MYNFRIGDYAFQWNGAHTVNICDMESWHEIDVFSLNYERDDYTLEEVKAYAIEWYKNMENANV
jgi:hypothetical protein